MLSLHVDRKGNIFFFPHSWICASSSIPYVIACHDCGFLLTSAEDLLFSVVRNLPRELDAVNKQRWDLVLVNQFLREVREAKKRGRREKRHKEAQAVLAAAAAAVAASSRNSSLRKDQVDDMITSHHEVLHAICSTFFFDIFVIMTISLYNLFF